MYCLESRMLNEAKDVLKYQQRLKRKKKEENKSSFLYLTYLIIK